jgi:SAM-dependent methyltransferase
MLWDRIPYRLAAGAEKGAGQGLKGEVINVGINIEDRWGNEEKFFGRSWTHAFYFWKLRQVMIGRTVVRLLNARVSSHHVRIVDLGCGTGTNLFDVCGGCTRFTHVKWYGLDLNVRESAFGESRSRYRVAQRDKCPVRFMAGDICHLPFSDNSMDIVILSEVVEHFSDPLPGIREIVRVLKPGGYAIVTTPNPANIPETVGYWLDRLTCGRFKKY